MFRPEAASSCEGERISTKRGRPLLLLNPLSQKEKPQPLFRRDWREPREKGWGIRYHHCKVDLAAFSVLPPGGSGR